MSKQNNLTELSLKAKLRLVKMHYDSKVGHIGGNLSSLDLMIILHHRIIKSDDLFILSKGHAAGALYITKWTTGDLTDDDLKTFHQDHTSLAGHPIAKAFSGSRFSTGSLGHGLGLATGVALARKLKNEEGVIYCLTSDGEWQEGSTWESFNFLVSRGLSNITVLVDSNKLQGFGEIKDVIPLVSLTERLSVYDIELMQCNGHNLNSIEEALLRRSERPKVVILDTVKGKGVSFMENKMEWHYLPLTDNQYQQAITELVNEK